MSSQSVTPNTEAAILARLIQARDRITPEVAQYLLSFDFDADDTERMNSLAEKAREGILRPDEAAELDSYLHIGSLISVMQSKARRFLKSQVGQLNRQ